jgi:hypothetical protein
MHTPLEPIDIDSASLNQWIDDQLATVGFRVTKCYGPKAKQWQAIAEWRKEIVASTTADSLTEAVSLCESRAEQYFTIIAPHEVARG